VVQGKKVLASENAGLCEEHFKVSEINNKTKQENQDGNLNLTGKAKPTNQGNQMFLFPLV